MYQKCQSCETRQKRHQVHKKRTAIFHTYKAKRKTREFARNYRNTCYHQGKIAHVLWEIFCKTISVTKRYLTINPVRRMHLFAKRTRITYKIALERLDRTDREAAVHIFKSVVVSTTRQVCHQWQNVQKIQRLVCFIHHCHSFEWNATSVNRKGCYHFCPDDCCHGDSKACRHGWIRWVLIFTNMLCVYKILFDFYLLNQRTIS